MVRDVSHNLERLDADGSTRSPSVRPVAAGNDIQVIARAAEVLRLLTTMDQIDVDSASDVLGISRSSAHRYLTSLERHGFLSRRDRNSYEVGTLMTQIGAVAMARSVVIRRARPVMEQLRDEVEQTITLALWNGAAAVVAHVVEDTSRTAHVSVRVGSILARHAAQTVVFRAFVDRPTFHRSAPVEPAEAPDLVIARREGVASWESDRDGIRAVAVPVFDADGSVVATLASVGIAQLMRPEFDPPLVGALKRASAAVSEAVRVGHDRDAEAPRA